MVKPYFSALLDEQAEEISSDVGSVEVSSEDMVLAGLLQDNDDNDC